MDRDTVVAIAIVVGALATAGGVIVTSILNIRSNKLTRRGLEQEQEIAQASAARAEAAAALNEEYTRRMVDALEAIAAGGLGAPFPAKVQWELVHHAGDTYRLTNVGELEARAVRLVSNETLPLDNIEGGPDLGPGEALTFMAVKTLGTMDSTITVNWREEPEGEERTWRYPLPARPPRR